MRRTGCLVLGALVLAGCGGGGGGGDSDWSFTFTSGGGGNGGSTGGGTIVVTGHGKAAPAFVFGEPVPFGGDVPPPDAAARALPPPGGFALLDAVFAPEGLVQLLAGPDGAAFLLLAGDLPQAVPLPAVRVFRAGPEPLSFWLLAPDGLALRADSRAE